MVYVEMYAAHIRALTPVAINQFSSVCSSSMSKRQECCIYEEWQVLPKDSDYYWI